jgi:hypothetical protein
MFGVAAAEFFGVFRKTFQDSFDKDSARLTSIYKQQEVGAAAQWTKFMLDDVLTATVKEYLGADCDCRREFYNLDLCAWRPRNDPYHKPQYRLPLALDVILEHENGPYPEEEFWKLLNWYAPLKVLVCYPLKPSEYLTYFNECKQRMHREHGRSSREEYLVIFGATGNADVAAGIWQGHVTRADMTDFTALL